LPPTFTYFLRLTVSVGVIVVGVCVIFFNVGAYGWEGGINKEKITSALQSLSGGAYF
jgi:uncharacterized membrane protein